MLLSSPDSVLHRSSMKYFRGTERPPAITTLLIDRRITDVLNQRSVSLLTLMLLIKTMPNRIKGFTFVSEPLDLNSKKSDSQWTMQSSNEASKQRLVCRVCAIRFWISDLHPDSYTKTKWHLYVEWKKEVRLFYFRNEFTIQLPDRLAHWVREGKDLFLSANSWMETRQNQTINQQINRATKQANNDWFVRSVRSDFESVRYTQMAIPRENYTCIWNEWRGLDYPILETNLQFCCLICFLTGNARGRIYFCKQTLGRKLEEIRQSITQAIEQWSKRATIASSNYISVQSDFEPVIYIQTRIPRKNTHKTWNERRGGELSYFRNKFTILLSDWLAHLAREARHVGVCTADVFREPWSEGAKVICRVSGYLCVNSSIPDLPPPSPSRSDHHHNF